MTDSNKAKSRTPAARTGAAEEPDAALTAKTEAGAAESGPTTETTRSEAPDEQTPAASATAADADTASSASAVAENGTAAGNGRLFQQFEEGADGGSPRELDMIMEIPVTLSVELGQTRLTIRELLDLAQGSIIELEGLAGEPMDVQINGYLIAQGEVVVVDDRYGIRVSEIVTPAERIHKLKR